jgi:preprotein translocase subunit Sss1
MKTIAFDTLAYANKLKNAGVEGKQAEIQAEALAEIIEERLATKSDIDKLESKITELGYKLTITLGGIAVVCTGVLGFIIHAHG